ncbi:hypothetical protein ACHAXA_002797 [Cyclostephanos tholiformis]|uniref:Kazal-like domain-containing protein n=1 Tax=Cyclostephanos tholiformis TaxID=382380 RepID=A0ABD3RU57_9STRA
MEHERDRLHRGVEDIPPISFTILRRGIQMEGVDGGTPGGGCTASEFCRLKTGTCRQIVEDAGDVVSTTVGTTGTCFTIPTTCPDKNQPVCGCDGNTYGSACQASLAGQSLAFKRPCDDAVGDDNVDGAEGGEASEGVPCDASAVIAGGGGGGMAGVDDPSPTASSAPSPPTSSSPIVVTMPASSSAPSPSTSGSVPSTSGGGSVGPAFSKPPSGGATPVGSVGPTLTSPPAGINSSGPEISTSPSNSDSMPSTSGGGSFGPTFSKPPSGGAMLTGSVGPAFSKPYSGGAIPVGSVGPILTAPPAGMNSLGPASGSDGMADESNSTETFNAAPTDTSIVDGEINEIIPANGSGLPPTDVPTTNAPTYAPITYRPTEFPTGSIREPLEPTRSPAPTILPKIVGSIVSFDGVNGTAEVNGTESFANYYINGTNQLNMTALNIANGGGFDVDGDGVVSEGEQFSMPEGTEVDPGSLSPTVTPSPLFSMIMNPPATLPPGTTPSPAGARMGTLPPGTTPPQADASMPSPSPLATSISSGGPVMDAVDDASTSLENTLDAFMDDRRQLRRREQVQDEEATLSPTFAMPNSTRASNATIATVTASSSAAGSSKVTFQICPDTELSFKDTISLVESRPPIILETPARHPIEIICLQADKNIEDGFLTTPTTTTNQTKSSSCAIIGGGVHILIKYSTTVITHTAGEGEFMAEQEGQPITISGVTFRGASNTSILMNDPRGNITFKNCTWEDNLGEAAMVIDGRYNASKSDDHNDDENNEEGEDDPSSLEEVEEELEPLYPDDPLLDDGTDDLIIEFDNPEDMTVSFESTSTSSTMSVHEMTTTVANDSDDDGFIAQTDSSSFSISTSATTATEVAIGAVDAETEATLPGGFEFNLGGRLLGLLGDGKIKEDEGLSSISYTENLKVSGSSMRAIQSLGMEGVPLRSKIFIEGCSFRKGKGNATVLLSSYFGTIKLSDAEENANLLDDLLNGRRQTRLLQSKVTHSIHMVMKMTSFTSEDVDSSIIENYAGRLQLMNCAFINNTAESIIRSEDGIVAIASTKFSGNDLRGSGSQIVLDSESSLETNDDNCLAISKDTIPPGTGDVTTIVSSANAKSCDGIIAGGVCSVLKPCLASTSVGEQMESCFSDWDDLVVAVRDRPSTKRDFIICPKSTLVATSAPVVIDGSYITIQCGTNWDKDCVISGGYSHFHIVGSSKGVQLARLTMSGATGSSIMALGNKGATLNLQDCEWVKNEGESAILIHNEQIMKLPSGGPLDITKLLSSSPTAAMSVEVIDCIFATNEYSFGAIANIGGTLTVYRSRFVENSALVGDIIVTNYGDSEVRESCFNSASSMAPGTVFVQDGSSIRNKDNFGYQNTAGGYGDGGSCVDVFLQMKDVNCILDGSLNCGGTCELFTMAACPIDTGDKIRVPYYNQGEGSNSSNIVPIIVAVIVCAFIVFGFIGILLRRRKAIQRKSGGDKSGFTSICCCKKSGGNRGDSNDEEMVNFDGDDNDPL